ncbi:glutamine amidotransferase-related protein [Zobellella maritima]|uniref:glutamine amidotransferase-related protein n=1 Tax=Zobellella maritima TaxID=2059725 RepID=UPI000E30A4CA|nr:amidotransferase [Zobellella maritima]
MQLGLLLCDHTDSDFSRVGGDYPDLFRECIAAVAPEAQLQVYDANQHQLPDEGTRLDGWIISGARFDAFGQYPWLERLKACVRRLLEQGQRIAGVCFGHQLLALMHGGEVGRAPVGWGIGTHDYRWRQQAEGHRPAEGFRLLVSHQDQVLSLPERARVLAGSDFCPNAAFTLDDRVIGVQGHPEFTPAYSRFLIEQRKAYFSGSLYRQAIDSLEHEHHGYEVMRLLLDFLTSPQSGGKQYGYRDPQGN